MPTDSILRYRETFFSENAELSKEVALSQKEMSKLCDNASAKIYRSVQKARNSPDYSTSVGQSKLLSDVDGILREFKADSFILLCRCLNEAAYIALNRSESDFKAIRIDFDPLTEAKVSKLVSGLIERSKPYITIQALRMFQCVKQATKKEAIEISRLSSIENVSRAEATKLLFVKNSKNEIQLNYLNKSGHAWSAGNYLGLVIVAAITHAENDIYVESAISNGHDVAIVSKRESSIKSKWPGKIISLTGSDKTIGSLASVFDEGKIFHPRSKHSLLVYSEVADEFLKEPYAV